jgi:hypothetical protein
MPASFHYEPGFFSPCIQSWRAAMEGWTQTVPTFDVIRRIRITEYWLASASRLSSLGSYNFSAITDPDEMDAVWLEVEAHTEAFYVSAFMLQEEVEYMARVGVPVRKFKSLGVTRARNDLVIHQGDQGKTPRPASLGLGGNGDVFLKRGWGGLQDEPDWHDPGLFANAVELRDAFMQATSPGDVS